MKALILGVGDAFTIQSFGSSAVVEGPGGYLLIDCPDLIHRALHQASAASGWNVKAADIDDIIITHLHGDHCNGLESFGFHRLVLRLQGRQTTLPRLHTHPEAAARIWERLAPAMDAPLTKGGHPSTLEDYFDVRILTPGVPATIAGLRIESRYTIHPIPTIGLRLSDGPSTLGWSGDTVYDPAHIAWLASADLIVHEANLGPAHTHIELLNALPDELRARMRLTHIIDGYDTASSDIPPLAEGEVLVV